MDLIGSWQATYEDFALCGVRVEGRHPTIRGGCWCEVVDLELRYETRKLKVSGNNCNDPGSVPLFRQHSM